MSDPAAGRELAERVRRALVEAAAAAWQESSLAGLCGEGAFEAAVGRMRSLDLAPLFDPAKHEAGAGPDRRG